MGWSSAWISVRYSLLATRYSLLATRYPRQTDMTQRLVQWDGFEVRLSGERAQAVARKEIRKRGLPLDHVDMEFRSGEIRVKARLRAALPVPFSFVIRRI